MSVRLECLGLTDRGLVRKNNEDQFLIADLSRSVTIKSSSLQATDQSRFLTSTQGTLLAVADGMGGPPGGEDASRIAIEAVSKYVVRLMPWFFRLQEDHEDDFIHELQAGIEHCQEHVFARMHENAALQGMGTTLTIAYIVWPRAYVVHVGDSRCYLHRHGRLKQVTRDHTVAQQLLEAGVLQAEEAEHSPFSHMLWNVVGGDTHDLTSEVHKLHMRPGDSLLLCSDGLSKHVTAENILKPLNDAQSLEETCGQLVSSAKSAGGSDNITVIVARFAEDARVDEAGETTVDDVRPIADPTPENGKAPFAAPPSAR